MFNLRWYSILKVMGNTGLHRTTEKTVIDQLIQIQNNWYPLSDLKHIEKRSIIGFCCELAAPWTCTVVFVFDIDKATE